MAGYSPRNDLLNLYRRKGYTRAPVGMHFCPSLEQEFRRNLGIAGKNGGLFCCPTHMLEPEVPWANIEAYAEACREM